MFNLDTVPKIVIEECSYNNVDIIISKNPEDGPKKYILFTDGIKWNILDQYNNKEAKEQYSMYDMAYGDVLLTGFGFGLLAEWIASKPEVTSVTVLEISKDIYDLYLKNNTPSKKIKVIITDASTYKTNDHYDCIFLDHYENQLNSWMFKNMKQIVENIPNHDIFWFWSLELKFLEELGVANDQQLSSGFLWNNSVDFSFAYARFKQEVLTIKTLPDLTKEKINEYVYTYFDRLGYSVL
jgi:hypothetical protein